MREQDAQQRTADGQQFGLHQHLSSQSHQSGPQHKARCKVALASLRPHKEKVRNVGADDEHDEGCARHLPARC